MKVTLREIARRVGVHQSTASHVLNGTGGSTRVGGDVRQRILCAADELGYRANRAAQQLRTRRSSAVGLLAGDVENPFFARLFSLCAAELESAGYECLLAMRREGETNDLRHLNALASRDVDGLLIWSETASEMRTYLEQARGQMDAVILGYRMAGFDSVEAALGAGVREALLHLRAQGARRVGYLCPAQALAATGDPRLGIYRETMAEAGAPARVFAYEGSSGTPEAARERTERLVCDSRPDERPDALLCFNDMTAIGAMMGLRRRGVRVPFDMALVGCDDLPLAAQMDVPLTSIAYPLAETCRAAVRLLLGRIGADGDTQLPPRYELIPAPLRVRESSLIQAFAA